MLTNFFFSFFFIKSDDAVTITKGTIAVKKKKIFFFYIITEGQILLKAKQLTINKNGHKKYCTNFFENLNG